MTIIVTGGAGFIGSNSSRWISATGRRCTGSLKKRSLI